MAIIICPDCRKEVSDKAHTCPHCGYPIYMKVNMSMATIKCSHCENDNDAHSTACKYCGAPLQMNSNPYTEHIPTMQANPQAQSSPMMHQAPTVQHGQPIPIVMQGTPNSQYVNIVVPAVPKNKWIAFGLCLCFGFLGAHKFYEGKKTKGIAYMFTFGYFGVGWIIDLFTLLGKTNPYYIT